VIVRGLDSDDNGRPDRVHIQYRLPADRSGKVAAVLEASPYLSGGNEEVRNHDVDVPLHVPQAAAGPGIQSPYERLLRPHGYAYVYAESIGTGSSSGCPTAGGPEETKAIAAVVRWLTGDARAVEPDARRVAPGPGDVRSRAGHR